MSLRVRSLTVFAALLCFALLAQAGDVYVWPNPNFSNLVNIYDQQSVSSIGSFESGLGPVLDVATTPDGQRRYVVGFTTSDALTVTTGDHAVLSRSGDWNDPGRTAVVTPDGKYALVVGGVLWIFDAATGNQVDTVSTGSSPVDVAVSLDSKYALVLSANSQRLYKVDLTSFTVVETLDINGESTGVSAGPNCLFYVSTTNTVIVVDGESMTQTAEIRLTGLPHKIYFTPNGRYGIATNSQTTTNASVWIFDLKSNIVALKKDWIRPGGIVTAIMSPRVEVVSNDRFFMTSKTSQVIYEVSLPDGNLRVLDVVGGQIPDAVFGIVKSNEYPNAKHLFFTEGTSTSTSSLSRITLDGDALQGTPAVVPVFADGLGYAGLSSFGTPVDSILYNDQQAIPEEEEFKPIALRALDADGLPVFNATVEWSAPPGVNILNAMTTTNKDGLAKAEVIANDVIGPIPVQVTVGGSLAVTFELSIGTGGGVPGQSGISIAGGQGQLIGDAFFIFAEPLTVQVTNPDGTPADGVEVTWTVTQGFGLVDAATTITNEDGLAANAFRGNNFVNPSESWEQAVVTATFDETSVDFYVTVYPTFRLDGQPATPPQTDIITPRFAERDLTARIGEILPGAIEAIVVGGTGGNAGVGIPNIALDVDTNNDPALGPWTRCAPLGFSLSGPDGRMLCDLEFLGQVGTSRMDVRVGGNFNKWEDFTVTVLPGAPSILVKRGGDGQSGQPGQTLAQPLVIEVQDAARNPLPGTAVTWQVVQTDGATLSNVQTVTGAGGQASATATLGNVPGNVEVRATAGGISATFNLQVLVQATGLNEVSGGGQSAVAGAPFGAPLVVQLVDSSGDGVAGQSVRFDVTSGSATTGSPAATTDAQGRASMTVTAGSSPGPVTVVARYGDLPPVTFSLAVRLPGPGINPLSFRNGASNAVGAVPGGVVKIVAPGLAPNVQNCVIPSSNVGALPYELAGVTVQFGPDSAPMRAPIYYVCNINGEESVAVQAPFELQTGLVSATVRVQGGATTVENVPVFAVQPGLFETTAANGLRHAVVMRPDGSFVSPENPARRGETLGLFCTGLGQVNPPSATNRAGLPEQMVPLDLVVGVNNEGVRVLGGEYAVNMIGVYVVYFEVPQDTTPGPAAPFALAVVAPDGQLLFGNGSSIAIQ